MNASENEPSSPTDHPSSLGRKIAVGVAGSVVTTAGVVMLVTPGPGILAILGGLGILGSEFPTARRALQRLRLRSPDET
ncbi:MAG: PGPGW domain-containing protein [Actinomycetota bacterium]|nr:PGPGW domain-containing protein [Actinomycetota bacterium]